MIIAWDYETHLISKEYPYPRPVCVSSYNGWNKKLAVSNEMKEHISFILDHTSVAHNAMFELGVTYTWFPELRPKIQKALAEGRIICTHVLQSILNSRIANAPKGLSLAALVLHYFQIDLSEDKKAPDAWRLRYSELDGVPLSDWPEEAKEYAIMDSVYALQLYNVLKEHKIPYQRAMEASFYLNMMGKTGIQIDQSRVRQLEDEIYAILEPKYKYLIDQGFCTPTCFKRPKKSLKKLQEFVKETIKEPRVSAKGNIQTDLEALLEYQLEAPSEVFQSFLDINEYDKVLTAFISRLKGADKIMTDYSTTKSTGRTSSSSSRLYPSVNIQQMPRKVPNVTWDVRNCFVPRAGYQMVSIDYSGLELASAATQLFKIFNSSEMLNMLNSGDVPVDLHSMLAAKIMSLRSDTKVDYATFVAHKKEEPYSSMRQLCKAINLGFPGGIGYDVMRKQLLQGGNKTKYGTLATSKDKQYLLNLCWGMKITEPNLRVKQISSSEYALVYDELVGLKKDMFRVYPDLERFLKEYHTHATTGEVKYVKNDFGEWEEEPMYKYKCKDFERDWCSYTAYCNGYLMQTPSAIGATQTAINLGRKYLGHPDMNLLAFIHDEFLFEVREQRTQEIVQDVAEMMIDGMQSVLKDVRIAVEASVMPYWTKEGGESKVYWKDANNGELRSK